MSFERYFIARIRFQTDADAEMRLICSVPLGLEWFKVPLRS
jgi:hypothetical protein